MDFFVGVGEEDEGPFPRSASRPSSFWVHACSVLFARGAVSFAWATTQRAEDSSSGLLRPGGAGRRRRRLLQERGSLFREGPARLGRDGCALSHPPGPATQKWQKANVRRKGSAGEELPCSRDLYRVLEGGRDDDDGGGGREMEGRENTCTPPASFFAHTSCAQHSVSHRRAVRTVPVHHLRACASAVMGKALH
jgi:hypothetical protein